MNLKRLKKIFPIEFYFVLVPSIFLFLFSMLWLKNIYIDGFGIKNFLEHSLGACLNNALLLPIISVMSILIVLFIFDLISVILSFCRKKQDAGKKQKINQKQFLSIFLILFLIAFATYSLMLFTCLLFKVANSAETGNFGKLFLSWDRDIFKTNPGPWLINKFSGTLFEKILIWAYDNLFTIILAIFIISFLFNKKAFKKLVLSLFISWMIALPFWFLFPVIPPDFMFRLNNLNMANSQDNKNFNNLKLSPQLKDYLKLQESVHIIDKNPSKRLLPISTFPSMHAAWGAVTVYAGMNISPWLGIILIPWAVLNGVGAVYVLEHYAVDIFFGTFIGLISIIITELLLNFENKYFEDKFGLFYWFDYISLSVKKFLKALKLSIFPKKNGKNQSIL